MDDSLREKAEAFAGKHQIEIGKKLGFGWDGTVYSTSRQSAIKVFRHERLFQRERDVYQRLTERHVVRILGFDVPQLVSFDNDLWVVEMTIVSPPFVLDFAGAYLDQKPDYPPEVLADWMEEKAEQFGERWSKVQAIMWAFSKLGVFLADVKPGNIEFGDHDGQV
jgi:hypothetical protein